MVRAADWIVRKRRESMTPPGAARPGIKGLYQEVSILVD
jgi:hypothetical protein